MTWLKVVCCRVDWWISQGTTSFYECSSVLPVNYVVGHVTPAVTLWPVLNVWKGTQHCLLIGSQENLWFPHWQDDSLRTHTDLFRCPNTNLHLYEKRERKGARRTDPVAFPRCNVKVWGPCRILAQMDHGGEKFSALLEQRLKGVSQSTHCASMELNKPLDTAATVRPDREEAKFKIFFHCKVNTEDF